MNASHANHSYFNSDVLIVPTSDYLLTIFSLTVMLYVEVVDFTLTISRTEVEFLYALTPQVVGLTIIGIGSYVVLEVTYISFLGANFGITGYLILSTGFMIIFISIVGLVGTLLRWRPILVIVSLFLYIPILIIFILVVIFIPILHTHAHTHTHAYIHTYIRTQHAVIQVMIILILCGGGAYSVVIRDSIGPALQETYSAELFAAMRAYRANSDSPGYDESTNRAVDQLQSQVNPTQHIFHVTVLHT